MEWPKTYTRETAPAEVVALAERLTPLLLAGGHSALETLRTQFDSARVGGVELTGRGFYVRYEVPDGLPRTVPREFQGGFARIEVAGLRNGAGCVLFVRDGQLDILEVYTYSDDLWPERAEVVGVEDALPIEPPTSEQE